MNIIGIRSPCSDGFCHAMHDAVESSRGPFPLSPQKTSQNFSGHSQHVLHCQHKMACCALHQHHTFAIKSSEQRETEQFYNMLYVNPRSTASICACRVLPHRQCPLPPRLVCQLTTASGQVLRLQELECLSAEIVQLLLTIRHIHSNVTQ